MTEFNSIFENIINEVTQDVIARDSNFPYQHYYYLDNQVVKEVYYNSLGSGNYNKQEKEIGSEDQFVGKVKSGEIKNVKFTRGLGINHQTEEDLVDEEGSL